LEGWFSGGDFRGDDADAWIAEGFATFGYLMGMRLGRLWDGLGVVDPGGIPHLTSEMWGTRFHEEISDLGHPPFHVGHS